MSSPLARIRHRHLLCFVEVARHGTMRAAADTLSISQPAASKTLRELEEALGTRLFERLGKSGMTMTADGHLFHRYAGASLAALKQGLDGLAQSRLGGVSISVGALPTVAAGIMPGAIRRFKQRHSAMLKIVTGPNTFLLEQLRLGNIDLVVGRLASTEEMDGFSFTHLYSERVVLVARPDHPLFHRDNFDFTELERTTVLLPTADSIIRPIVDQLLLANGVGALADCIETVSPDFCRQYVRASDAIWIISRGVVDADLRGGLLRTFDVDTSDTRGAVGLTVRADSDPTPMLRSLMDEISAFVGQETD